MDSAETRIALIVDSDAPSIATLHQIVGLAGYSSVGYTQFPLARQQLQTRPPAVLIANARLDEFNGIHLVYLARALHPDIRAIIYARPHDPAIARDAQLAGAFYERWGFLGAAIPVWLGAQLPAVDRRVPTAFDRRLAFRGGRRTTDIAYVRAAVGALSAAP